MSKYFTRNRLTSPLHFIRLINWNSAVVSGKGIKSNRRRCLLLRFGLWSRSIYSSSQTSEHHMVQREIKGTDLESICLERFFFFFSKESLSCNNVPYYEYTSLPGKKKRPFKFNIRNFSKSLWWLPIAKCQLLNKEAADGLSLSRPPSLHPGHVGLQVPCTPQYPACAICYPRSSPAFAKRCAIGPVSVSLEFLSPQAYLPFQNRKTSSVVHS